MPAGLHGLTLREADLRRTHGLEVVLIHTPDTGAECLDGRPGKLPTPDARLEPGDRLLVIGTPEALDKLRS